MTKCRQVLLTISVEIDDNTHLENVPTELIVNELDYEIKSTILGVSVVNTELIDYEEIETARI